MHINGRSQFTSLRVKHCSCQDLVTRHPFIHSSKTIESCHRICHRLASGFSPPRSEPDSEDEFDWNEQILEEEDASQTTHKIQQCLRTGKALKHGVAGPGQSLKNRGSGCFFNLGLVPGRERACKYHVLLPVCFIVFGPNFAITASQQ